MQRRALGATGLQVSRLGLGLMTWGRATDEHEARDQLIGFLEAGGNLLDTAHAYAEGGSERMLGSLLGDVVPRDEVVIASKAGFGRHGDGMVLDTSRVGLLRHLDASLERMGVDHVDLWQTHVWSDNAPIDETLAALDHAVSTGRAAYVGISNYTGWQTAQAATWQRAVPGRTPLASTQMGYSLLDRSVEQEVLPAAEALGLGFLAYSPLGRGVLTGKYRHGTPSDSRGAQDDTARFIEAFLDDRSQRIVEAVARAADGLGWSCAEVALAWVRDRPGVTSAIVGARTAAQLKDVLGVESLTLPDELVDALDDVSGDA